MPRRASIVFHTPGITPNGRCALHDCAKLGRACVPRRPIPSFSVFGSCYHDKTSLFGSSNGNAAKRSMKRTEDEIFSHQLPFSAVPVLPPQPVALNLGRRPRPLLHRTIGRHRRYRILIAGFPRNHNVCELISLCLLREKKVVESASTINQGCACC